jgi:hypothetical protein
MLTVLLHYCHIIFESILNTSTSFDFIHPYQEAESFNKSQCSLYSYHVTFFC